MSEKQEIQQRSHCLILQEMMVAMKSEADVDPVMHLTHCVELEEGTKLYEQGEEIEGVHCLHSGSVVLLKEGSDGAEYVTSTVHAGDILGMPEILNSKEYLNTAVTLEPSRACFIPRSEFLPLIREYPAIIFRAMQRICMRIQAAEEQVETST